MHFHQLPHLLRRRRAGSFRPASGRPLRASCALWAKPSPSPGDTLLGFPPLFPRVSSLCSGMRALHCLQHGRISRGKAPEETFPLEPAPPGVGTARSHDRGVPAFCCVVWGPLFTRRATRDTGVEEDRCSPRRGACATAPGTGSRSFRMEHGFTKCGAGSKTPQPPQPQSGAWAGPHSSPLQAGVRITDVLQKGDSLLAGFKFPRDRVPCSLATQCCGQSGGGMWGQPSS